MKVFIITAILLLCIGFIACEKEDIEESSLTSTVNSDFYRHKKAGGDEYKNFVLDFLAHVDDSIPFTGNFVATYGLPQWDLTSSYGVGEIPSLIVPVYDEENSALSSLLYFVLENGRFDYYLLMNDRDDIAYEKSKGLIQYYELTLGLERSNTDFFIKIDSTRVNSNTKAYRAQAIECYYYYVGTIDDPYQVLHGHSCSSSADYDFETDRGDWDSNLAGTGTTEEDPKPANGGGGGDTPNPDDPNPLPEVLPTPEFTNSKVGCIYDKLKNLSGGFAAQIQKFDGEFPVSHLKFDVNNNLELNNYGRTLPPINYVTVIELNNNALMDISNLGTALVIAHEVIHAEIFRKMLSVAKKGDLNYRNWPQRDWETYFKSIQNDFSGIYDYYMRYEWNTPNGNPISDAQHEMMASHYIKTLADIIQVFDNNGLSRQEYEDICWLGLRATEVSYNKLSDTEKERIKNNIIKYIKNGIKECN